MNYRKTIETRCIDCQSFLIFDNQSSTFRCPKCYDRLKVFTVWCPYCGSYKLAEYTSGDKYRCNDCGEYYHLWDSPLILNNVLKRLDKLEQIINEKMKELK